MNLSPYTRRAGELCLDCIRDVAPNSNPTVRFEPGKSGMIAATFAMTINGERKSTTLEFYPDDWHIDEGEWEAQMFWFTVRMRFELSAPGRLPKDLRPRRKGPPVIPGESAKPVMGFWR